MRNTGNQHVSHKGDMLALLSAARAALRMDTLRSVRTRLAQSYLATYAALRADTPASTLRRWRCGR